MIVINGEKDAWDRFSVTHHRGEKVVGEISRIVEDIGLFVELENKIEGIVHLNDLDWNTSGKEEVLKFSLGDQVEVVILTIEKTRRRICLGIKQLKPRPDKDSGENPSAPTPVIPKNPNPPEPLSEVLGTHLYG